MGRPRVLLTRDFIELDISDFRSEFDIHAGSKDGFMSREELFAHLPEADAAIIRHQDHPNREFIDAAPNLKIIANYGAGFETVDVDHATERGIWVTNTPDVLNDTTADLAMTLLLCVCRRVTEGERYVRQGKWITYDPNDFHGSDPRGKTLGIVGMGRIGQEFARLARTFKMKIIYHNRRRVSEEIESSLEAEYVDFSELLARSDFISLHTPLTDETRYLLDTEEFEKMKGGVYVINTARGQVVRESALAAALRSGKVAGAGLDVHENEPQVHPEFFELENVVLLPHLGSATLETRAKMAALTVENVRLVLGGQRPKTPVNEVSALA
ncbi:MAG: D-glycerate dehydrogenase [Planctomycetota bacterium]|jgi:glyoxylate reductase|nr:D-glycerate dehydrogenase [Planctomycetota bacterium]MDP7130573.1 D-glycerate dehydrogenase [Planctomycetota bacterium]